MQHALYTCGGTLRRGSNRKDYHLSREQQREHILWKDSIRCSSPFNVSALGVQHISSTLVKRATYYFMCPYSIVTMLTEFKLPLRF